MFKEFDTGPFTISELCRRYGISRGRFYVWKMRRDSGRARWFVDLSHAVGHCPLATAADLTGRIVTTRQPFPHCGPKKIRAWLSNRAPGETWPVASTIADILKREGLVEPRRRQRRPLAQGEIVAPAVAANEEWAIGFKGHFRTASGVRYDPLTVTDQPTAKGRS